MLRNLSQFNGDALIVGGGWCEKHQRSKPAIRETQHFYTIDKDDKAEPDAVLDITDEMQCVIIPSKRFSLIFFECFSYINEEKVLKAFKVVRRMLKDDGVIIYVGGSAKSDSSIPDLLKAAGFLNAIKKEFDPENPKAYRDNGSISLASDTDIKVLQENMAILPETTRFYLTLYQFFKDEHFVRYAKNKVGIYSQINSLEVSTDLSQKMSLHNIQKPNSKERHSSLFKNLSIFNLNKSGTGFIQDDVLKERFTLI